jgi:hypothetical protein
MLGKLHCLALGVLIGVSPFSNLQADTGGLTVRVIDAVTKQPVAARLVLLAADGSHPGDRIGLSRDKWPGLEAHGIFLSGETTFMLPAGKTFLAASRGPQYEVARREIEIVADKSVVVELPLQRRLDLKKLGWVCGDAHLHMIHGEMQRQTSYPDIAVTCRANGLDWACVNQEYGGAGELTLDGLHAECRKVSDDEFQLSLGGERPKSLLGHHALIGVNNPFVIPDDPPYHRAAKLIHDQGGVLFPVHPVRYFPGKEYRGERLDFPGNNLARELVFDAYLGPSFDGLSVLSDEPDNRNAMQLWFHLLNMGLFVPAFADSDACFDRPTLQKNVPGFWATYLYVGPEGKADHAGLAQAVREGRTMATTGPILLWDVDGHRSGDTLPADGAARRVTVEAWHGHHNWTLEEARVSKIELIRNGEVIRTWEPDTPDAKVALDIEETEPCWYAVRALGTDQRWQVVVASPIFFAAEPVAAKRKPLTVRVRGRVYDFVTGQERPAVIRVERHSEVLKEFEVEGQFAVEMPLDASISAVGEDGPSISHDLLLDYGPVHRFLWNLDSEALGKRETFTQFESLVREVDLEFPLGHRMAGCYVAKALEVDTALESLHVTAAPKATGGPVAVAAILLDKRQAQAGDVINTAVVFHDQGEGEKMGDALLVAEGRAYDPRRPSGFNPLKVFGTIEANWSQAESAGHGFRLIRGALEVPDWVDAGSVHALEINAFARRPGGEFLSHVGLRVPLGPTSRSLMVASHWPTVPISWPDHNYGIGILKICGKLGRVGQPRTDYRTLGMKVMTAIGDVEVHPARDCRGCADADDAIFTGHFFDQNPGDESIPGLRDPIRAQPPIVWRELPVIDATTARPADN